MAWLCIDAGTSVIKSVVFSEDGRTLALARTSVAVARPRPEMAEQDMEEVWQAVVDTGRRAVAEAGVTIGGIATTAQGDGVWLVDEDAGPLRPAVLWNDGRASAIVDEWQADGVLEDAFQTSGSVSYPGLPNSIWRWLEAHEPQTLRAAKHSLTCNGWLHLRLTGEAAVDLSDASNPFCDVRCRKYSEQLLDLYGVSAWARLLPPIHAPGATGNVLVEVAEALGVPPGVPVVMAPYDIVTTAYGSGCLRRGQACVILGTTICAEAITDELNARTAGTTIALEEAGSFLRAMPTLTGCEALDWTAKMLKAPSLEALSDLAATSAPGSEGVLFLPYLSPAGERSPFLHPHARGSWSGLSLVHGEAQLARSVYEGLSYVIRECLAVAHGQTPAEVTVCGGGARSSFWCQMIADVVGCDVVRPGEPELGAKGALLYGLTATGAHADLGSAFEATASEKTVFSPQTVLKETYQRGYARFLAGRALALQAWGQPAEERAE